MSTPQFVQLFGPVQNEGSLFVAQGPNWHWPGAATTASTKTFNFQFKFPRLMLATYRVIWATPNTNTYISLLQCDDGPTNISNLLQIQGNGSGNPTNSAVDITSALNQLVTNGVYKTLGFQLWDDGVSPARIYEVRLELVWNT